jgi:pyruvate formate lyase activating enzyme
MKPQLLYRVDLCAACGHCVALCPEHAIEMRKGYVHTDRQLCVSCGRCVDTCDAKARSIVGNFMTAPEVYGEIETDSMFYEESGGGATLSGGEVLSHPEFARDILKLCRSNGIHTAVETSGYAAWETVRYVMEYVDLVLYDIKHMDSIEHMNGTGVPNDRILSNIRAIRKKLGKKVTIRIPVIPGYNDSEKNLRANALFIANELGVETAVELLPYHRLGEGKRSQLEEGQEPFSSTPPDEAHMKKAMGFFTDMGLAGKIGG